MRVTTQMIGDRTVFNLSRSVTRLLTVESQLSTGRRINTPSDDPIGTQHDLNYRSRLADIEQYKSNISQGLGWLSSFESGLDDLKNLYSSAKEIAIMMANDTYDEVARGAAANEIKSLYEQVLQIGNNKIDGRYMYSGHLTRTQPLETSANGVVYMGDRGLIDLEVETGSRITSNLIGADVFLSQLSIPGAEADLEAGLTGAELLSDLNLGEGVDLSVGTFEVYDANRDITYTVDISSCVTVNDVISAVNTQLGPGSNLTLGLSEKGANLQWEPAVGVANSLTDATPLSNLNEGLGIDTDPGKFRIRTGDGSIEVEVNVATVGTVGEVITAINDALTTAGMAGVSAGYNASGTGLAITDTNGVPLGLVVEDIGIDSTTAADLGLVGNVGAVLDGRDLVPQPEFVIRDIGAQTTAADLGLPGTVQHETIGEALRPRLTVDTTLASLNNNSGLDLGQLKICQGNQAAIIDAGDPALVTVGDLLAAINSCGLSITATINEGATGIQIESDVDDRTLIIQNNDESRTAQQLGISGSSDMLGSLMLLETALRENDRELAEQINGDLEDAIQHLLSARADIGARMIRMETTQNRLDTAKIYTTKLLSEVEDADIIDLTTALAQEENMYQAALMATSRIIQPSLLDFLD